MDTILPEKGLPEDDDFFDEDEADEEGGEDGEADPPATGSDSEPPAPEPKQEPQQMVPLRELTRLRAERKALRDQLNQVIGMLGKAQQQAPQPAGEPRADGIAPMPGESDGEYLGRVINHLVKESQETKQEREARQQREQQERAEADYTGRVMRDYQEFSKQAPDLLDAGIFLAKPIEQHLARFYPPQQVKAMIGGFERDLHQQAEAAGLGYGEYIWQQALAAGYVPQAQRQKQEVAQQRRQSAERTGRGLGGGSASAGGMTQMEAVKAFQSGAAGRSQKIPELGNITVEQAFVTGQVRKLRK